MQISPGMQYLQKLHSRTNYVYREPVEIGVPKKNMNWCQIEYAISPLNNLALAAVII